jgi:hypothetical protein
MRNPASPTAMPGKKNPASCYFAEVKSQSGVAFGYAGTSFFALGFTWGPPVWIGEILLADKHYAFKIRINDKIV